MINDFWIRFKNAGFSGSIAIKGSPIKSDSDENDSDIYEAVFELDPDYTQACIIKGGLKGALDDILTISLEDLAANLDNAILDGLGHKKAFVVKETGALVRFGYKNDDILQF